MQALQSIAVGVALALGTTALQAADLRLKAPPKPVTYSWAGFYIGANLGGTWDRAGLDPELSGGFSLPPFAFTDTAGLFTGLPGQLVFVPGTIPLPGALMLTSGHSSSFMGGAQAGYNWQWGSTVFGLEGQIDGLHTSQSALFVGPSLTFPGVSTSVFTGLGGSASIERNVQGSLRGRLGYANDRWLIYGTGGPAFTSVHIHSMYAYTLTLAPSLVPIAGVPNPSGVSTFDGDRTLLGATIGAGFEYAMWNNVSVGVEYRHTFYGRQNLALGTTPTLTSFSAPAAVTPGGSVNGSFSLDTDEVAVRMNWAFNK
jgi:outer membrane immunogenic protein